MKNYPIPNKLNLLIASSQVIIMMTLYYFAGKTESVVYVFLIAVIYGIVMNSAYALLHEAEHNLFNKNQLINNTGGVILGFFFPAPYHLLRQGHLGHHVRNRSDDEAFDFYFEGEFLLIKYLRLYGILIGLFWVVIVLTNIPALLTPNLLKSKIGSFDRPTEAVLESLNSKYKRWIQLEALGVIIFQGLINWIFGIPIIYHFIILYGFGFMWSTIQYVHHFGTEREVRHGAKNLKTFFLLDLILLNHNWHLNHHYNPTISWKYLSEIDVPGNNQQQNFMKAYLLQWKGPKKSKVKVENKYAGKIIR